MSLFHHTHCPASLAAVTVFLGTQGLIIRDIVPRCELAGLLRDPDNKWSSHPAMVSLCLGFEGTTNPDHQTNGQSAYTSTNHPKHFFSSL